MSMIYRCVLILSRTSRYWWVLAIGAFVMMSGGGDGK